MWLMVKYFNWIVSILFVGILTRWTSMVNNVQHLFWPEQLSTHTVHLFTSLFSRRVNSLRKALVTSSSFRPHISSCHKIPRGFTFVCVPMGTNDWLIVTIRRLKIHRLNCSKRGSNITFCISTLFNISVRSRCFSAYNLSFSYSFLPAVYCFWWISKLAHEIQLASWHFLFLSTGSVFRFDLFAIFFKLFRFRLSPEISSSTSLFSPSWLASVRWFSKLLLSFKCCRCSSQSSHCSSPSLAKLILKDLTFFSDKQNRSMLSCSPPHIPGHNLDTSQLLLTPKVSRVA